MHTDLGWVRSHTRLQVRALEWQSKHSDSSYLLTGSDLKDAENWVTHAAGQPIKPTALQSQYIVASRDATNRVQKRNLTIAIVVAVVATGLAIAAIIQYFAAKHETKIATSGRIAATAITLKDSQLDVASLLGIEANRIEPTLDALNAQVTLFESSTDLVTYLHQPGAQTSFIDGIAFSLDGKRFATVTDEGVITLWNASSRLPVATLPKPINPYDAYQIAFSPDGSTLAVANEHYVGLQLWNIAGPHPTLIQPAASLQPESLTTVAFHPSGKLIAIGGDGGIQLWTFPELRPLRPQPRKGNGAPFIDGLAFSPTDPLLLAYTVDGVIYLENPVTGQSRGEIKLPSPATPTADQDTFGHIAFSPDGTQIAAGPRSGTILIWNLEPKGSSYSGSLRGTLDLGDNGIPMGLAFRPDGKEFVAISNHGAMRKWDTASLKLLRSYPSTLAVDIRSIAFTRDGSQIFAGINSGIMLLWSDTDLTLRPTDKSKDPEIGSIPSNPGDPLATVQPWITAAASPDTAIRLTPAGVEVRAPDRTFSLPESPERTRQLAISPDGRFVAASSLEGNAKSRALWDISQPTPRAIPLQGTDNITFGLTFSPSSNLLATAEFTGLYLWDTTTGKLVGENIVPNRPSAASAAFSPDGSRIALVISGDEVLLLDAATQRLLGTHVFAGTENFGVDPATVAFSKDGRSLFIRSSDGSTVLKWDADPESWADRACSIANRNLSLVEWKRYIGDTVPYHRTCPQYPDGEGVTK